MKYIISFIFFITLLSACHNHSELNYKPLYFETQEDSIKFSHFLHIKNIQSFSLEDVQLDIANFPHLESKSWKEIQEMDKKELRNDPFMMSLDSLFYTKNSYVTYIPKNLSISKLQKISQQIHIPIKFDPIEINFLKKVYSSLAFILIGIFWIFLRKQQAFFSLFASTLGFFFTKTNPNLYFSFVTIFFSYAILLDNWANHYRKLRNEPYPTLKCLEKTSFAWFIFISSFLVTFLDIREFTQESLLITFYFFLLLLSTIIWNFWLQNRREKVLLTSSSNFFPSYIISQNKNMNLFTIKGFLYLASLLVALMPILINYPNYMIQKSDYLNFSPSFYPNLERESLFILFKTPKEKPSLSEFVAHRFYQKSLVFDGDSKFYFSPKEETIDLKSYAENKGNIEEKIQKITVFDDKSIKDIVKNLPEWLKILVNKKNEPLIISTVEENFIFVYPFEKTLIYISLFFTLIFSLKIKSYFRMIDL